MNAYQINYRNNEGEFIQHAVSSEQALVYSMEILDERGISYDAYIDGVEISDVPTYVTDDAFYNR